MPGPIKTKKVPGPIYLAKLSAPAPFDVANAKLNLVARIVRDISNEEDRDYRWFGLALHS